MIFKYEVMPSNNITRHILVIMDVSIEIFSGGHSKKVKRLYIHNINTSLGGSYNIEKQHGLEIIILQKLKQIYNDF